MRRGLSLSGPPHAPQLGGVATEAIRLQCVASGGDPDGCKKAASGDFSGAVEVAGSQGGKAACAAYGLPSEAAGACGSLGGFVGKTVWGTISDLFSSTAPCECQLGACDKNDDFDHAAFNVKMSLCKSPVARAAIDKSVEDRVGPNGSERDHDKEDLYNRLEICMKLAAYAECAKAPPFVPTEHGTSLVEEFQKQNAACKSAGFQGWVTTESRTNPDGSWVLNGACGDEQAFAKQALIDCLGKCGDDACGAACKAQFPTAVVPGATDGLHDGSSSSGSGAGTMIAAGLGLAAAYAGWRLYKGKKIFG